jgi:spermidine synthase
MFGSGFCALVYQIVWMREFRLVFGASTAASAAVVAIFVGGLGLGGLLIGRRADRHAAPLWLYGQLEVLIALSAALTPALLWIVRSSYIAIGGTPTLGLAAGTILRLFLATLVLAVPTVLMGGTLPAAARAVETAGDRGRTSLAVLYGVNTLGAVIGAFVSTFFLIEVFGSRKALWIACLVNLLVALFARQMSREWPVEPEDAEPDSESPAAAPATFIVCGAAVVGFAFFLMELVWYRMLGPILGGTVFTFGLILTVALLGIGLGGALYGLRRSERTPTLASFAHTCLLEALCLALPFALGDRVALLALVLRRLGSIAPFWGDVLGWALVCSIVVLPAAIVAGYQFPMLIALLGQGRKDVGRQTGLTYAWNTVGGIAGSLAGGFGLLPLLSAPGAWRAAGGLLVVLGIAAIALSARRDGTHGRLLTPALLVVSVAALFAASGPTAAWRHSGIGAGRSHELTTSTNSLHEWLNTQRRIVRWEADGYESSVALNTYGSGYAFVINGKNDGSARGDAATMIMSGLLGAILHPNPRSALVIGLGTGATAGWLGSIPGMERTDVVEIEDRVLGVARDCAPINQAALSNPKIHVTIDDAREILLVSRGKYDLIASEPSNPYRAGVASLFTHEFYRAASERLAPNGLFLQWIQAYEVDSPTIRTIYATLASVFPVVETWQVEETDLLLVASNQPIHYDVAALRQRLTQEPYRTGIRVAWRATDLEGVLARLVASSALTHAATAQSYPLNTDDQNLVEFGFARSVGQADRFIINEIRQVARLRHEDRPEHVDGEIDWNRVDDERIFYYPLPAHAPTIHATFTSEQRGLAATLAAYNRGDLGGTLRAWRSVGREPRSLTELELVAAALAEAGDEAAMRPIAALAAIEPLEARVDLARLRLRQGRLQEALTPLEQALSAYHTDPWPDFFFMEGALDLALELASRYPDATPRLLQVVGQPFTLDLLDEKRVALIQALVEHSNPMPACAELVALAEPNPRWNERSLAFRLRCYAAVADPRQRRAARDLREFRSGEPSQFGLDLLQPVPGPTSGTAPNLP